MRRTEQARPAGKRARGRALARAALVLLVAAGAPAGARAALDVQFRLQPDVLQAGEAGTAAVTVRGVLRAPEPSLPEVDGLVIRLAGTERRLAMGSGGGDSAVIFRYALTPLREGDFRIGPFRYAAGRESVEVPAVTLKVIGAAAGAAGGPGDLVFARLEAARTNVFLQATFDVDLVLGYRQMNLAREISLMHLPAAGLELQPFQELPAGREVVDGAVYEVRRFRARTRALTAGTFRLAPVLRLQALVRSRGGAGRMPGDPLFERLFGSSPFFGGTERRPFDVPVSPVDLVVRPLPEEDRPPSFSGAVGRFEFKVDVKPREVNVGDPVTVTMTVTGRGNPDLVAAPAIGVDDRFRAYEAKLAARDIDEARGLGSKRFEQVLLPRDERATEVPAVSFSYFDPEAAAYRTLTRGPFPLVVHPSTNGGMRIVMAAPGPAPAGPAVRGEDIVYLKPAPSRWERAGPAGSPPGVRLLVLHLAGLAALLALYAGVRRRERLLGDEARRRRERAPRAARAALRRADAAAADDAAAFHDALWAALRDYFGDRLNLPPGDVTAGGVARAMRAAKAPPDLADEAVALFDLCERERFARGPSGEAPADARAASRERVGRLLRRCERYRLA